MYKTHTVRWGLTWYKHSSAKGIASERPDNPTKKKNPKDKEIRIRTQPELRRRTKTNNPKEEEQTRAAEPHTLIMTVMEVETGWLF